MFKNSVRIFVEKIYKMGCLMGSGVPVLYIGRTVPKNARYDDQATNNGVFLFSKSHRLHTIKRHKHTHA
jgi:hypothetical protein